MRLVARAADVYGNSSVRLEGGTALAAYYLAHRESEDLDFFSDYTVDQREFGEALRGIAEKDGLRLEQSGPRSQTFTRFVVHDGSAASEQPLKIDLAGQSPFRLAPLEETTEGIRIASFRDLAASKLHAICDRVEVRDFIDLHVILTRGTADPAESESAVRQRIRELVCDVLEIDPGLNVRLVGDAVARGLDRPLLANFPLRVLIPLTDAEVQATLRIFTSECATLVAESLRLHE